MKAALNAIIVDDLLLAAQVSQADVARELGVSREAVSKWLSGESAPRPKHRAALAALLGVSTSALYGGTASGQKALVRFTLKAGRNLKDAEAAAIRRDSSVLAWLEQRLSRTGWLQHLPEHRGEATLGEARVCGRCFREAFGLQVKDEFRSGPRLFSWLAERGVYLVPALWGEKQQPLRTMCVRLPGSGIHWMYLDLDAPARDVQSCLLHELARMIRRHQGGDSDMEASFANAFADEVLFPHEQAEAYIDVFALHAPSAQAAMLHTLARTRNLPPATIHRQVNVALAMQRKPPLAIDGFLRSEAGRQNSGVPTWADVLFGGSLLVGLPYFKACAAMLSTPVFLLAAREVRESNRDQEFIERLFRCTSSEALLLLRALGLYGAAIDSAESGAVRM